MKNKERGRFTVVYHDIDVKNGRRTLRYIEFVRCEKCGSIREKRVK